MAGTVINEDNLVYKTIQSSLTEQGITVSLEKVLELGAGKEKYGAIRDILFEIEGVEPKDELVARIHQYFLNALEAAYEVYPISVFSGVEKILPVLKEKQIKIAFNTGYSRHIAEKILQRTNLLVGEDIDILMTASDVDNYRPEPDMILKICNQLNIPASQAIKVGDSKIDIEEGRAAEVKYCIGITTGAQSRGMLEEAAPDFILDDMFELTSVLEQTA